MYIVPPITITDDIFDSSSITEPSPNEANGITALTISDSSCVETNGTYNLIFTGGSYTTIATGNYTILSNTITSVLLTYGGIEYESVPTVATQSGDGSVTATWEDSGYRGQYNPATTYSVNAIVCVVSTHKMYESLQNANVGYTPGGAGNDLWWLELGSTERWKAFDTKVGSQVEDWNGITYALDPTPIDSISLLNIEASTVTVTVTDVGGAGPAIVWSPTVYASGLYITDVVKLNLSLLYLTPHVVIEIDNIYGSAKVGEIVLGAKESIGDTRYSPSVSIIDYSVKEVDDFGNYTVLERAYSKRLECDTIIENAQLDSIYNVLAEHRAQPVVWVGSESYASMIVYGFYRDFSIVVPYKHFSACSIEIEGLV